MPRRGDVPVGINKKSISEAGSQAVREFLCRHFIENLRGNPCFHAGEEAPPSLKIGWRIPAGSARGPKAGNNPSPMLEGVSYRQHRSYLSELLTIDRRAQD